MVKKSFTVNNPANLNLSFMRIETFNPKSTETILKNKNSILVCHGYQWLNTAIKTILAKNPNMTELNIDVTLHTTYLPDPTNPSPVNPGLGVWASDPNNPAIKSAFIEASSCQITFNINGEKFPFE
jgi:hypothetical protein